MGSARLRYMSKPHITFPLLLSLINKSGDNAFLAFIFFLSILTRKLLTPNNDNPDALKISFAIWLHIRARFNLLTCVAAVGSSYSKLKYDIAAV